MMRVWVLFLVVLLADIIAERAEKAEECVAESVDLTEIVDAEVHLNDPLAIPRRGSVMMSLLDYLVPSRYYSSLVTGYLTFPRTLMLALNGEGNMSHVLERFDYRDFMQVAKDQNLVGFVSVESNSIIGPSGQQDNKQICLVEARWLASKKTKEGVRYGAIASAGGATMSWETRKMYLDELSRMAKREVIRGIRWTAAFVEGANVLYSFTPEKRERVHLMQMQDMVSKISADGDPLVLEIFVFHPHLRLVHDFARKHPQVKLVVVNTGGPLLCGLRPSLLECEDFIDGLSLIAQHENVYIKVGGFGAPHTGFQYVTIENEQQKQHQLVADWGVLVRSLIQDLFGPQRVMFGSNFPFDMPAFQYDTFWNAIREMVQRLPVETQKMVLSENAKLIYRLA